jgi:hypothetical protein
MILERQPRTEVAGQLAEDVAGQILFEGAAHRSGMTFTRELSGRRLNYRFEVGVPGSGELRQIRAQFSPGVQDPSVYADGPPCLRHRWNDDSLCMWTPSDEVDRRWVLRDGLLKLEQHIEIHTYCEAECRAGNPWPKDEGPGEHPRKRKCPSCHGRGR